MCSNCDTQYAAPMEVDASIYDTIYANPLAVRGYSRYQDMADLVLTKRDPLKVLAEIEEPYWFVADHLRRKAVPKSAAILEVGCGLGYLTFALNQAGYKNARGIDVSTEAVNKATRRYGQYYFAGDIFRHADETNERYDLVIMTELIEHVPNITEFIHVAHRLMNPNSVLLLTTPNKSAHPPAAYWCTDNPPVHLWWLSETSLRQLAIREGLRVEFCDWTEWHQRSIFGLSASSPMIVNPIMPPYIDNDGSILAHPHQRPTNVTLKALATKLVGDARFTHIKRMIKAPRQSQLFYRKAARLAAVRSDTTGAVYYNAR